MYTLELAQAIHQEKLRQAEQWRLSRQVARDAARSRKRLRSRLGDLLIAFGNRLKAQSAMRAQASSLVN
jgi:hypothetical protein